ncbi:twitching motility protein PilT, partial [Pseudomonas sp. GW247-3R2A]
QELLSFCLTQGASDLHLSAGLPPMIRIDGDMRRINLPVFPDEAIREWIMATMTDAQKTAYEADLEIDYAYEIPGVSRFRVNAFT